MSTEKSRNLANLLNVAKAKPISENGPTETVKAATGEEKTPKQAAKRATQKKAKKKSDFWDGMSSGDEAQAVDRLNVEIPRALHQRLKRRCAEAGATKKEVVIAMIERILDE